jgi:hypothetical protein
MSRRKSVKFVTENKRRKPNNQTVGPQRPAPYGLSDATDRRIEVLTGAALFIFGVYYSILYFGYTAVPNGDFISFFQTGKDLLSLRMPASFMVAPVLGLLQNLLAYVSWGPTPYLTAGWLLNAILHPFTVVLLWLVGKKILGGAAVWFAIIAAINPWTIYSLTQPIVETTYLFFILLTVYLILGRSRWAYPAASVTMMVRYEGAALILAAFIADIIHSKSRGDIIKAIGCSALASMPLAIWLLLTVVTWQVGSTHYFNVFFSKEYAKAFVEPVKDRTGFGLHLQLLWQTGFQPLLMPYPTASADFVEVLIKLSKAIGAVSFLLGCIFAILKRSWEVLVVLLFFVPYFVLHAYYPYPFPRFHSTIFWIAILISWFGLQNLWRSLSDKWPVPKVLVRISQVTITIIAVLWVASLAPYLAKASAFSPRSASMPYAATAVACLLFAGRLYIERTRGFLSGLTVLAMMCLMIISNQFSLVRLLGDGKREIEFKMLGEWFAENAGPGDKMAVYNCESAALFAGKFASNITNFPKADNPEQLVEKLYEQNFTYVVWATREGMSKQHTGYHLMGLDKNIAFLEKPMSIGPYEFVRQIGSERGFVNVFHLKSRGAGQPPEAQN